MRPVPPGVPGELYLGGSGLARGYLGRPELTAERFVPDALSGRVGARLYATGDVCRWREDGRLEFCGRADRQVKLRGFRIELGEVEAALGEIAGVADAVAEVREVAPGDSRLVAYCVLEADGGVEPGSLRARLAERLPEPMLPSFFVPLEQMPRLPNGKLDRAALPPPGEGRRASEGHVAPRTETERRLAALWSEVLGVAPIGVHDSFFELGGHSLLATQLVSRVREAFDVELPLRELFEASTVAACAAVIDRSARGRRAPAIEPVSRDAPLEPSFAQERLWVQDRLVPGDVSYNMPVAVRLRGALDLDALRGAFDAVVARHEALRTTFEERDGRPVQVVHEPGALALPLVDLSGLGETERSDEARRQARRAALEPFDLEHGPLVRAGLWRLDAADHLLGVTLHHIVSDGWSMGVLVSELAVAYTALAAGREPLYPALPVQYADHAAWQRRWLGEGALDEQLAYWKRQLVGLEPLALRADRPRPAARSGRGAAHAFRIDAALAERIKQLSDGERATPFMVLVAAFEVVLHAASGQRDLAIGSDVAGRTHVATEGLIGFFVNQLVLRTRLEPTFSFRELVSRVRETTLAAYEHQELPFDRLVAALNPPREAGRLPLVDVKLVLQNAPRPRFESAGVVLEPVDLELGTAKFDLLVNLQDTGAGIEGEATWSTDLFDRERIAGLVERFEELLRLVVEAPEARIEELVRRLDAIDEERRSTRRSSRRHANLAKLKNLRRSPPEAASLSGENRP
jgi:acyl carrier protein